MPYQRLKINTPFPRAYFHRGRGILEDFLSPLAHEQIGNELCSPSGQITAGHGSAWRRSAKL
jgi:hypothetical protein